MNRYNAILNSLAAALVLLFASGMPLRAHDDDHSGHASFDAGEPADASPSTRRIEVVMREQDGKMLFAPDRFDVKLGERITFVLRNDGELDHEFVIGSEIENAAHAAMMEAMPDMSHSDPNAITLKVGMSGEFGWTFSKPGAFEIACLIPGHYQSGMKATVYVSGSAAEDAQARTTHPH